MLDLTVMILILGLFRKCIIFRESDVLFFHGRVGSIVGLRLDLRSLSAHHALLLHLNTKIPGFMPCHPSQPFSLVHKQPIDPYRVQERVLYGSRRLQYEIIKLYET